MLSGVVGSGGFDTEDVLSISILQIIVIFNTILQTVDQF